MNWVVVIAAFIIGVIFGALIIAVLSADSKTDSSVYRLGYDRGFTAGRREAEESDWIGEEDDEDDEA